MSPLQDLNDITDELPYETLYKQSCFLGSVRVVPGIVVGCHGDAESIE